MISNELALLLSSNSSICSEESPLTEILGCCTCQVWLTVKFRNSPWLTVTSQLSISSPSILISIGYFETYEAPLFQIVICMSEGMPLTGSPITCRSYMLISGLDSKTTNLKVKLLSSSTHSSISFNGSIRTIIV